MILPRPAGRITRSAGVPLHVDAVGAIGRIPLPAEVLGLDLVTVAGNDIYVWAVTIYLLTSTISVPFWGKLSDLYGRKPMFMIGIVIFLIGLAAWALFSLQALFVAAVLALALLSSITFVLRVVHVGRQLSIKER